MSETLDHLGKVLFWLEGLSDDYRCKAIEDAVAYYNANVPNKKVDLDAGVTWEPVGTRVRRAKQAREKT